MVDGVVPDSLKPHSLFRSFPMARQANPREDLLAQATALIARAGLLIPSFAAAIVVGFRSSGAASVYFGQDEAYHFESAGSLRRAYFAGRLYKADRGRLASLERKRTASEVQLVRHDLSDAETASFVDRAQRRLADLRSTVAAGQVRWLRQMPEGGTVRERITTWLAVFPDRIEIARSPRAG